MSAPMISNVQPIRFADYDLVHLLGRGGMGEVWSAVKGWQLGTRRVTTSRALTPDSSRLLTDPFALNKSLALKIMHPELSEDEQYREMFVRETGITMQLSSANIVSVFEIGEHDRLLYMAMERIDGVNLFEFQDRVRTAGGHMPLDVTVHIIYEILTALFVAHEHTVADKPAGVIHRDVKPGNVLISSVGDVVLTDFGIARPVLHEDGPGPHVQGTLRYMAPEQARGLACKASDLFAVGAIFHELVTGRRFRDTCRTDAALARDILGNTTVPATDRTLPPKLEYVRQRLLAHDVRERISDAREALALLSKWPGREGARLKIIELYEKVVGSRSSGFTKAHPTARPSFIVERRARAESELTLPVIHARRFAAAQPEQRIERPGDDDVYDEATTTIYERLPWLDSEPSRSSPSNGPETDAPIQPRQRTLGAVHHAAANTRTPLGPRDEPIVCPRPAALTPTELLPSFVGPTDARADGRQPEGPPCRPSGNESRSLAGTISSDDPPAIPQDFSAPRPRQRRVWLLLVATAVIGGAVATAMVLQRACSPLPVGEARP
ncbi:MAG: serine/threonine protein kinase [Deltaproteobacteria bacterium]|nr:serine/threonine protein kinase [Deltaproteobacteria bacterium]